MEPLPVGEKSSYICHKGHEFIPTLYHFPTSCEACTKPLWNVFKPPPALECRRCHIKCHKDHMDRKEDIIAPCKGEALRSQTAEGGPRWARGGGWARGSRWARGPTFIVELLAKQ